MPLAETLAAVDEEEPHPIRYGRRSQSRGDSYTMVFSRSLDADLLGRAIVVPCRGDVSGISDLVAEAEWLWAAERNCSRCDCVSGKWGCVSVVENEKNRLPKTLREGWTQHVSDKPGYGKMFGLRDEPSAVDDDGFLAIPWPLDGSELELDLLLSTATKPVKKYPDSDEIARAWSEDEDVGEGKYYVDYFPEQPSSRDHDISGCCH